MSTVCVSQTGDFVALWRGDEARGEPFAWRSSAYLGRADENAHVIAEGLGERVGKLYVLGEEPAKAWLSELERRRRNARKVARANAPPQQCLFSPADIAPTVDQHETGRRRRKR